MRLLFLRMTSFMKAHTDDVKLQAAFAGAKLK